MPWTIFIPIAFIGGFYLIYFLFKDKFTGKYVKQYNDALEKWSNGKDEVIKEFFSNPSKFGILQQAVGETPIEAIIWGRPPKNVAKNTLKKGAELLLGYETFDMSAHYMVIAGDELFYLHSDGKTVIENIAFDIPNLSKVSMQYDSGAKKIAKYMMTDNSSGTEKFFKLKFESNGTEYTFNCQELIECFAVFSVEKHFTGNRKFGQNPFYRVEAAGADYSLMNLFGEEMLKNFKARLERVS